MSIKNQFIQLDRFSEDIAKRMSSYFLENSQENILVSFGGGNTPREYNQYLVEFFNEPKNKDELKNYSFTLTDERHVPLGDPSSNSSMILETFIKPLNLEDQFIYPEYKQDLRQFCKEFKMKIDLYAGKKGLCILGVGADGHTASLYPGKPIEEKTSVVLVEKGHDGLGRISLSQEEILEYKSRWFLANNESKKAAVERAISNDNNYEPIKELFNRSTKIFY